MKDTLFIQKDVDNLLHRNSLNRQKHKVSKSRSTKGASVFT
jgi:hypothetical protein